MEFDLENIIIAFVTGLTTGGLSCLAVQGGLLASSLAGQIEKDFQQTIDKKKKFNHQQKTKRAGLGLPILAFLVAKIAAYTLLGLLLGALGQVFQLSLATRAILQIGIGIFMFGTAMRMFNVHPIFRYFAFEPPAFLRRKLRQTANSSDGSSLASPIFLGLLTVLIPCGVTQAMMAVALGTGNPLQGAALMFAFTLGTSPVFFAVSYFATKLGAKLEKNFMRFTAVVVLILALITIDSGVTLIGSPFSVSRWINMTFAPKSDTDAASVVPTNMEIQAAIPTKIPSETNGGKFNSADPVGPIVEQSAAQPTAAQANDNVITVIVENYGYTPSVSHAKAGVPIKLQLVSEGVQSCSRAFIIPGLNFQKILPETGIETVDIPAQAKGTEMPYSCSMGMYSGTIIFDL
jgi:sulfite exporter TauE/SafE